MDSKQLLIIGCVGQESVVAEALKAALIEKGLDCILMGDSFDRIEYVKSGAELMFECIEDIRLEVPTYSYFDSPKKGRRRGQRDKIYYNNKQKGRK